MQFDPGTALDTSQITFAKPYHGPAAQTYTELINWKANHHAFANGLSPNLLLVFIAVFCLMFCLFGIYDLYKKGEENARID